MYVFLVAFKYEGDPVTKLIKWDNGPVPLKPFSDQEIRNLVVYFSLMFPKENLFSQLTSMHQATLHLVYPYIQVTFLKLFNIFFLTFHFRLFREMLSVLESLTSRLGDILRSSLRKTLRTFHGVMDCLLSAPCPEADAVLPPGRASEAVSQR